jgi:hypothetical protein
MSRQRRLWPGPEQLVLRSLVGLGTLVVLWAAVMAGARPPLWLTLPLLGTALLASVFPDSPAGLVVLLGSALVWTLAPEPLSPLVLVAAAGMVAAHVALLVAAQGPARVRVDPVQVRRWAGRALLLWSSAVAVWGLAVVGRQLPDHRAAYTGGLLVLAVAALAASRRLTLAREVL